MPSPTDVSHRPDAEQTQQLPYPLTFRLVNPKNGRVAYAGIREFSAEEGEAALSDFLRQALDLRGGGAKEDVTGGGRKGQNAAAGETITVHSRQLPRGTYVKLRPLEPGYDPEDWKALLEQHLRQNYTTLTNGEVLVVPHGRGLSGHKEEYRFLVDGFKPEEADAICVVDTDLEVDIEALNEEQARETLKRIADKLQRAPGTDAGSSSGGEMDLFKPQEGRVLPGEYVDYQLPSWNRSQPLEFELSALDDDDDDLDLFASPFSSTQRAKPRLDEHVFADLDTRPRKRIRLEPSNVELENADEIHVSVHSYAPQAAQTNGHAEVQQAPRPKRFTLRAQHPDPNAPSDETSTSVSEVPPNPEDVRCKNCGQWVPQRTLMLHENFCLRNNILCPRGCGQVFQKRSAEFENHWHCPHDSTVGNSLDAKEKHDSIFHPPEVLRCSECSTQETFPSVPALARHRTTTCPAKPILCRFCHLVVPQEGDPDVPNAEALLSGLTPHELADGARTTECHLCSRIVRLRDMETHMKNHDLDRFSRPPPIICRNLLCGRTVDGCTHAGDTRAKKADFTTNDIGLCGTCFGPLYVSMYDPDGKALVRRIERKYLQQFVTGCGKQHCRNEFCKAGRNHLGIEKPNLSMKEAMPVIKPSMEALKAGDRMSALHFCVDEGSQQRRALAEMLAAEVDVEGKGGYGLPWCVGALEAEGGALEEARQWLRNFAPRKVDEGRG